jgi:hypothetical protein
MEHRYIQIGIYEKWTNSQKIETRVNSLCKIKANELQIHTNMYTYIKISEQTHKKIKYSR